MEKVIRIKYLFDVSDADRAGKEIADKTSQASGSGAAPTQGKGLLSGFGGLGKSLSKAGLGEGMGTVMAGIGGGGELIAGIVGGPVAAFAAAVVLVGKAVGKIGEVLDEAVEHLRKWNGAIAGAAARFDLEKQKFAISMGKAFQETLTGWEELKTNFLKLLEGFAPLIKVLNYIVAGLEKVLSWVLKILNMLNPYSWLSGKGDSGGRIIHGGQEHSRQINATRNENRAQNPYLESLRQPDGSFRAPVYKTPDFTNNFTNQFQMNLSHDSRLWQSLMQIRDWMLQASGAVEDNTRLTASIFDGHLPQDTI